MSDTTTVRDVQAYWDARPCNIRHSTSPVGSWEFYREVDIRKRNVEPHIDRFANYSEWKGKTVLEVGCGIGTDTERFARAGAHVTAIDLSPYSVELTARRLKLNDLPGRVLQGNAEALPALLGYEPFDLVYSFGVIHHTPHPEHVLQGMRQLSHPATVCKVMVYNKYSLKTLKLTKGRFWRDDLVAVQSEAETGCPITHTYSTAELANLLYDADFWPTAFTKDHIFPYRVKDYVNHKYVRTLPLRYIPRPTFDWMESHWGWHLMVEARPC